ncbi:MAG: outer membrane lipoprotein chaperone LolA [Comamonas sp.]
MKNLRNWTRSLLASTLAGLSFMSIAVSAHADGLQSLASFVESTQGGRAAFTQVVTAPPKDGQAARPRTSSGSFAFLRPNRFKFDYAKPFEQKIVSDGQTLWLHDVDLNQVTARPLESVLSGTPAAVIASARNLDGLRKNFDLQAIAAPPGAAAGTEWVEASPKGKDGQIQSIKVGFAGKQLAALDILDSFGQRSVITFDNLQTGSLPAASDFKFTPPPGADVVRP